MILVGKSGCLVASPSRVPPLQHRKEPRITERLASRLNPDRPTSIVPNGHCFSNFLVDFGDRRLARVSRFAQLAPMSNGVCKYVRRSLSKVFFTVRCPKHIP